jgi:hypothetical protein
VGLSCAQEQTVQKRVDEYLSEVGGTQVALNKIDLDGTGMMLVALPGEATARDLSRPRAAHVCYGGDFCGWSKAYKGVLLRKRQRQGHAQLDEQGKAVPLLVPVGSREGGPVDRRLQVTFS